MVEHRAQRVAGAGVGRGFLDGLGDGQAERALVVGIGGQRGAPGVGQVARAGEDLGAPGLHHRAAERLLLVADLDHEDAHRQAEHLAGEGYRRTPLAGAGLGGQPLGAGHLVVEGLRHGGVRLVRTGRRNAFVLVEKLGRRAERLLQTQRATERGRAPQGVDLAHFLGNGDPALGRHFLLEDRHREDGPHLLRRHDIAIRRQRRRRRIGQVGRHVVPVGRDFFRFEVDA